MIFTLWRSYAYQAQRYTEIGVDNELADPAESA
jgi:hypothetical protein